MAESIGAALERLFVNRHDDYAIQQPNGQYLRANQPLTLEIIEQHINGKVTVGVYQLNEFNCVKYLCFDLDPETNKDPLTVARRILEVLLEADKDKRPRIWSKSLLLEASRYPDNSYHLWVFFEPTVPAKVAKWLGLRILELANLNPKNIEVFPKQPKLTKERPFGNLVKLPLGLHQVEKKWSRFVDLVTFEPLPPTCLFNVEGVNFSEAEIDKILNSREKATVQISFDLPKNFKTLKTKSEAKITRFLLSYWKEGQRNRVEMAFLGWCLKRGVSLESALRIIDEVTRLTNDLERYSRLELVKYHYRNRRTIGPKLLGISGLRQIVKEAIQ
jgi:hypothetical protein